METLKLAFIAALLIFTLCACGTPDAGYKHPDINSVTSPRVRELRHLLLLPPSFQWIKGGGGVDCSDTERIREKVEESVAVRLTDWKDYEIVRTERTDIEARLSLSRLHEALSKNTEDDPFVERVSAELREHLKQVGSQYNVDGVVVVATREVDVTPGMAAQFTALSLPTLGIGGMAYLLSVTSTFAEAAIYDIDGNLQWWFRGQGGGNVCAKDAVSAIPVIFDTLPNARPSALSPSAKSIQDSQ